jgi:hypothetical protein
MGRAMNRAQPSGQIPVAHTILQLLQKGTQVITDMHRNSGVVEDTPDWTR